MRDAPTERSTNGPANGAEIDVELGADRTLRVHVAGRWELRGGLPSTRFVEQALRTSHPPRRGELRGRAARLVGQLCAPRPPEDRPAVPRPRCARHAGAASRRRTATSRTRRYRTRAGERAHAGHASAMAGTCRGDRDDRVERRQGVDRVPRRDDTRVRAGSHRSRDVSPARPRHRRAGLRAAGARDRDAHQLPGRDDRRVRGRHRAAAVRSRRLRRGPGRDRDRPRARLHHDRDHHGRTHRLGIRGAARHDERQSGDRGVRDDGNSSDGVPRRPARARALRDDAAPLPLCRSDRYPRRCGGRGRHAGPVAAAVLGGDAAGDRVHEHRPRNRKERRLRGADRRSRAACAG